MRTVTALLTGLALLGLTGCHTVGHAPPGQVKKVVSPPPGHGGVPPGQAKKHRE